MRRITAIILFILLLSSLVPVLAEPLGNSSVTVKPHNEAVNVRSGPGTEYTILGTLPLGTSVLVLGRSNFDDQSTCSSQWLQVLVAEDFDGWVNVCGVEGSNYPFALPDLLAFRVTEAAFPVLESEAQPVAEITGDESPIQYEIFATTTKGEIVVRDAPGLGNTVIGKIPAGAHVEMLQQTASGSWIKVRYRGVEGWVFRAGVYVTDFQNGLPLYFPPAPPPNLTEEDIENGVLTSSGTTCQMRQVTYQSYIGPGPNDYTTAYTYRPVCR